MTEHRQLVSDMLAFDPLDFAGKITGVDYKQSEITETLGIALHIDHGAMKKAVLEKLGDTTVSNKLDRYVEIITGAGFVKVFEERFESHRDGEWGMLYVYARPDGFVLKFDTYWNWTDSYPTSVNSGKLWYNWSPSDAYLETNNYGVTSSGSYTEYDDRRCGLWVGDHDCREALLHNIAGLLENGRILSPWVKRHSCFWLVSYQDHHELREAGYPTNLSKLDEITNHRLAQMPAWVQEMVGHGKR